MDLDDLEVAQVEEEGPWAPLPPPRSRGPQVAAALVAVAIVAGLLFFLLHRSAEPKAASPKPPSAPLASEEPRATPPPIEGLPALDESDAFVREQLSKLLPGSSFASFLAQSGLVRRFVAAVSNIAQGENPAPHLRLLAPKDPMRAVWVGGRFVIDKKSYVRYDAVCDVVSALDADAAAKAYRRLSPLIEAAARDLGGQGQFDSVLSLALARLIETPVPRGDVVLIREPPLYRFADKELESLAPAQKQLLRMGPRNEGIVQGKAREFRDALQLSKPR